MARSIATRALLAWCSFVAVTPFLTSSHSPSPRWPSLLATKTEDSDEADRFRKQAEDLRKQIREMESALGDRRPRNYEQSIPTDTAVQEEKDQEMSLKGRRILVVGANGRLGSMVCRYLLRNNPQTEVVACVHYMGEDSPTSRGYGRLSYEVGAEDGIGNIGAAWSPEDRTATFQYADYMKDYNLHNLRLVECELLDPVQCATICEGVDSVVWCATDFNGNKPRAISGLNVAFLFRALADPTKGRVEIEGLRNMLGALKNEKQDQYRKGSQKKGRKPIEFVLVSADPDAFDDFETPFGTFNGLKREGEDIVQNEFPSLSYSILHMSRYDDNFVPEDLSLSLKESKDAGESSQTKINRRDAARATCEALTNQEVLGKKVRVWTWPTNDES